MKNIKNKIQKWVAENNAKILSERKKRFRQSITILKHFTDYALPNVWRVRPEILEDCDFANVEIYLGETSVNVYDSFGVSTHTKLYAEMACSSCGQLQFKIIENPLDTPVSFWAPTIRWEFEAELHLLEEHSKWRKENNPYLKFAQEQVKAITRIHLDDESAFSIDGNGEVETVKIPSHLKIGNGF